MIELQNYLTESDPAILHVADATNMAAVRRYQEVLLFLLASFVQECDAYAQLKLQNLRIGASADYGRVPKEHPSLAPPKRRKLSRLSTSFTAF